MEKGENLVFDCGKRILQQVSTVIVGKDETLAWVIAAILAGGHILLEDIPGVGKTTMAVALSKVLDLGYNRVQFTPDVLPSDITGYTVPNQATGGMEYKKGAVLCNLFMADELNRATSRTQSALLEAMEEGQVTVDGQVHKLPRPFFVIATQNPTGAAGTQMLPDSQMDRFALRLSLGYPKAEEETRMVMDRQGRNVMAALQPVLTKEALVALQDTVAQTYISKEVVDYAVALIWRTRTDSNVLQGASPRATLWVVAIAKALAQLQGRDYVVPEDVRRSFMKTVPHRLILTPQAQNSGMTEQAVLEDIVRQVSAPALK